MPRTVSVAQFQAGIGRIVKELKGSEDLYLFVANNNRHDGGFIVMAPEIFIGLAGLAGAGTVANNVRGVVDDVNERISENQRRKLGKK